MYVPVEIVGDIEFDEAELFCRLVEAVLDGTRQSGMTAREFAESVRSDDPEMAMDFERASRTALLYLIGQMEAALQAAAASERSGDEVALR